MPAPKDKQKYEEWKEKLRQCNLGKKQSKETIIKMRGKTPWNKGLKYHLSKEMQKKVRAYRKGKTWEEIFGVETAQRIRQINKKKLKENPPMKGKKHTKEARQKIKDARKKQVIRHSEETKRKIGLGNKGKVRSEETRRKLSELVKGENHPFYGKPSGARRKDITKETILETLKEIVSDYGTGLGRTVLVEEASKRLKCGVMTIVRGRFKNMEDILRQLGIDVPKIRRERWKPKQDIIEDVVREIEGDIDTQRYIRGVGRPDIITKDRVYDAKSYFYMGWQKQLDKYSKLNKEVRFIVFEDKGETDVPAEKIILLRELVKKLPGNKRLLIQEKIERIKRNVPLEQMSLESFGLGEGERQDG